MIVQLNQGYFGNDRSTQSFNSSVKQINKMAAFHPGVIPSEEILKGLVEGGLDSGLKLTYVCVCECECECDV